MKLRFALLFATTLSLSLPLSLSAQNTPAAPAAPNPPAAQENPETGEQRRANRRQRFEEQRQSEEGGLPEGRTRRDRVQSVDFATTTSLPRYLRGTKFVAPQTTAESRAAFLDKSVHQNIEKFLSEELVLSEKTEEDWGGAYWTAGIINYDSPTIHTSLTKAFAKFSEASPNFQRIILQAVYTLYPGQYLPEVEAALPVAVAPKSFAIAAYHLLRENPSPALRTQIATLLNDRFPATTAPQLIALKQELEHPMKEDIRTQPPLVDLLAAPIVADRPVIFSLQRMNRNHPGIAIVRGRDGKFLRNQSGGIFQISQHARSRTDLPGTITFGNSPRGIFSIKGTGIATNEFIGAVPYLWSRIPLEADPKDYFFDAIPEALQQYVVQPAKPEDSLGWSRDLYTALLPESWKNYRPIYEAYLAGEAGRSEMIIHGTSIDPEFYKDEIYYPHTPSAGCIGALEFWSPEDGSLIYSGQLELLKAFTSTGTDKGFMVIVEVDAKEEPVRLDDVLPAILSAEQRLAK